MLEEQHREVLNTEAPSGFTLGNLIHVRVGKKTLSNSMRLKSPHDWDFGHFIFNTLIYFHDV